MDKIFKLTASEYASMLGLTTSAIRKRRLKGLEKIILNLKTENTFIRHPRETVQT